MPPADEDRLFSTRFIDSVIMKHGNISLNSSQNKLVYKKGHQKGSSDDGEVLETNNSCEIEINAGDINLKEKNSQLSEA
jgi:hypothetical protein